MEEFSEKLLDELSGATKIAFLGIGEEKLTDDGVGPYITSELLKYNSDKILIINSGTDPMNRRDEIIDFEPSHLVMIDTCTLSAPPGTLAILNRENIAAYVPISSHTIPVHIVFDLIMEKLPNLRAFMIGIVPESLRGFDELFLYKEGELTLEDRSDNIDLPFFDIQLTDTIKRVADEIIQIIINLIEKL